MAIHGGNARFPAYTDLRPIASGGHGLIHLGRHVGYDMECVQKTYERPGRDDAVAFAEPRLIRELEHPHIIQILDAQPDGDRIDCVTFVMPYYPAGSLYDRIKAGHAFSVGQVVEIIGQVADALHYLHVERGLLHRDVKPQNLLLDARDNAVLCDFGTAAVLDRGGLTGPVRASVPYQPPETARFGWMCPASDIYGLGLTAWEMLNGRFLYEGLSAAKTQARVDGGRRAYPASVLASGAHQCHIPASLRAILVNCVARDAESRPSAANLASALSRLNVVDWRRIGDAASRDGEWHGSWPIRARPDCATELRIQSNLVRRGPRAGRVRYKADYRRAGSFSWRTIGSDISPCDLDGQDAAAASRFFRTVAERAAQRFPA